MEIFAFVCVGFVTISQTAAVFTIDAPGIQQTKCIVKCPLGGEMVCGSDGQTYQSRCHLSKQSCETKTVLQVAYPGSCGCPTSCYKTYKAVCAILSTSKKEKTYPNMCEFRKAACKMKLKNKILKYKKKGPCKKMKACPSGCQDIFAPVCGLDNKTYSSVCALKIAACNKNTKIGLSRIGKCNAKECPDSCPMNFQIICGSDGLWHPSECDMKLTACRNGKFVKRVKRRKSKKTCGSKKCAAYCPKETALVCGEDGLTYTNECQMMKINCEKGKKIKVASNGKCGLDNYSKRK